MKDNLFSGETLQKIQKIRKIFLRFAVWILIAELVLGAILILTESWNVAIGRIQGTFLVLALILFVSVNNFIRVEKGNKVIQIFASVGFVSNLIWGIFAILLIWDIVPYYWTEEVQRAGSYSVYFSTKYHMTFSAIAMLISSYAAAAGFWISNVLSIKETIKLVKPLKITAVACVAYLWVFGTIATPIELEYSGAEKLYQLAGLAGLAFGITALAALIISRTNKKKAVGAGNVANGAVTQSTPKTEAELRAEIEEKVRREMLEKEIRAKMEAERSSGVSDSGVSDSGMSDSGLSNSGAGDMGAVNNGEGGSEPTLPKVV